MAEPSQIQPWTAQESKLWNELDKTIFQIKTPIKINMLKYLISHHTNWQFINYIVSGLKNGFRIGYNASRVKLVLPNLSSINLNKRAFHQAIDKEVKLGQYAGLF